MREAGSGDLIRYLEQGELDLAIVILPLRHPALVATPFLKEELVLAVSPEHELAGRSSVGVAELRQIPFVMFRDGYDLREATLAACRKAGFEPRVALDGGEMDSVLRLVAAGMGVAVVPSMVVEPGGPIVGVRLTRPTLSRTLALANRRDRALSRAARAFSSLIQRLPEQLRSSGDRRSPPTGSTPTPVEEGQAD